MRSFATVKYFSAPLNWFAVLLGLGLTAFGSSVRAESPETAPQELTQVISEIEAAANNQDVEAVMQFYSPEFSNSDGLSATSVSQALTKLWERYPQLSYTTELQSWEQEGDDLVAETVTTIQGTENNNGRAIQLDSTIRSRQYFRNQKLIRQDILSEKTNVTSGDAPPEVSVNLPEQVQPGEEFNFDVVVQQPIGEEVLLGAALEEPVSSDRYLNPGTLELDILPAGGIFKLVKIPQTPKSQWLSAILVQSDGITMVTRRVNSEE